VIAASRPTTSGRPAVRLAPIDAIACLVKRGMSDAKIASPSDPPIWRKSELRPVASLIFWRGMLARATVVSGMNRQLNATP